MPRWNSASKIGSSWLNVKKKMTPMAIDTNSSGGQTLLFSLRRNTDAGEKKMSIRSSQNEAFGGAAGVVEAGGAATEDGSVMVELARRGRGRSEECGDDPPGQAPCPWLNLVCCAAA